ncbi:hypothetical protein [Limnohabitans sp. 103DPR2]|uniref:hypothetical protein n=1 Tax=Limnohabitans sp. 103DPR2 TaxID=1678129 RepID=UPI0012E31933|nr:hypothetical protein [Limnohabitans sp. 103DPR2]
MTTRIDHIIRILKARYAARTDHRSYGSYQPANHKPAIDVVEQCPAPVTGAEGTSGVDDVT